jgi:hypothetical protein
LTTDLIPRSPVYTVIIVNKRKHLLTNLVLLPTDQSTNLLRDAKMYFISFCLSFTTSFALCNDAVGTDLFIILYLSCSGIQNLVI